MTLDWFVLDLQTTEYTSKYKTTKFEAILKISTQSVNQCSSTVCNCCSSVREMSLLYGDVSDRYATALPLPPRKKSYYLGIIYFLCICIVLFFYIGHQMTTLKLASKKG